MPRPQLSDFFIRRMLSTPVNEMLYIENVSQASLLGIQLFGGTSEFSYSMMSFESLCENARTRSEGWIGHVDPSMNVVPANDGSHHVNVEVFFRGVGNVTACTVWIGESIDQQQTVYVDAQWPSYDASLLETVPWQLTVPHYYFYPPEFPLNGFDNYFQASSANPDLPILLEFFSQLAQTDSADHRRPSWCHRATSASELTICENALLSAIDIELNVAYSDVRTVPGVLDFVRERLELRDTCGANIACLVEVTETTVTTLRSWPR